MKNGYIIPVLILMVLLQSCEKKEKYYPQSDIEGSWSEITLPLREGDGITYVANYTSDYMKSTGWVSVKHTNIETNDQMKQLLTEYEEAVLEKGYKKATERDGITSKPYNPDINYKYRGGTICNRYYKDTILLDVKFRLNNWENSFEVMLSDTFVTLIPDNIGEYLKTAKQKSLNLLKVIDNNQKIDDSLFTKMYSFLSIDTSSTTHQSHVSKIPQDANTINKQKRMASITDTELKRYAKWDLSKLESDSSKFFKDLVSNTSKISWKVANNFNTLLAENEAITISYPIMKAAPKVDTLRRTFEIGFEVGSMLVVDLKSEEILGKGFYVARNDKSINYLVDYGAKSGVTGNLAKNRFTAVEEFLSTIGIKTPIYKSMYLYKNL